MATTFQPAPALRSEERFFLIMAWVMAITIAAGFSLNLVLGRSTFAVPVLLHVHALVFFGWTALYVVQNTLVAHENVALHRRLGWLAVVWLPAMLVLGAMVMVWSLRERGGPPFFHQSEFLFGNSLHLLNFAGLVATALTMRRSTAWHRRLMFTAMATLTGPGLGRLLPLPLLIPYAWWGAIAVTLVFPVIGMIADKRRHGRVHPAWLWGIGAVIAMHLLSEVLAYSEWGLGLTRDLLAGTTGGARPMDAFMP